MRTLRRLAISMSACVAATSPVGAADTSVFHDQPASPRSLPADNLPPFSMLDDRGRLTPTPPMPAAGLQRGPGAEPESSAPGPSLQLATEAGKAAIDACLAAGARVGVAVIDSIGEARAMLTADGSDGSHVFVAMRKAEVSVTFGMSSSQAHDRVAVDAHLLKKVTPAMFVEGGAVPIMRAGKVIGAIGVSGAAGTVIGHQDEACAEAGLRSIQAKLK